jgi:hypothetical protein
MVIDIGATEPFDTHAAEMLAGLHEHDPMSWPRNHAEWRTYFARS